MREELLLERIHRQGAVGFPASILAFTPTVGGRVHGALTGVPRLRCAGDWYAWCSGAGLGLRCCATRRLLRLGGVVDVLPWTLFSVATAGRLALLHQNLLSPAHEISVLVDRIRPLSLLAGVFTTLASGFA